MEVTKGVRREEWRKNWTLVVACAVGLSFSVLLNNCFGLFIEPISHEFGWGRAQTSAGMTLGALASVLLSPVVGAMIDKFGVRRIALPGLVLLALSIASFSLANGSTVQWFAIWAAFALIDLAVKTTIWTTAVAGVFNAERSLAIAFTLGGVSLAQIVAPPLAEALISGIGWRGAFISLGIGWGGVALVLSLLFLFDARDRHRRDVRIDKANLAELPGLTVREALVNPALIRIAIATFLTMLLGVAVLVHQVPILTSAGISRQNAALIVSLGGAAGIAGKIITGLLMDRADAGKVGAVILAGSAIGYSFLLDEIRTIPLAMAAVVIAGFASATKLQICAYMTSRYAGMRNFGTIFGIMSSLIALGGGGGPVVAGLIYDAYGTYNPLIIAVVIGTFLAAWLIGGLSRYPVPQHPAQPAATHGEQAHRPA